MLLHYLDELEQDKANEAELRGEDYSFILDKDLINWPNWAMPKKTDSKLDTHSILKAQ